MLDSASVNSISSMPSPVYQCRKALRRNMAVNCSATRFMISSDLHMRCIPFLLGLGMLLGMGIMVFLLSASNCIPCLLCNIYNTLLVFGGGLHLLLLNSYFSSLFLRMLGLILGPCLKVLDKTVHCGWLALLLKFRLHGGCDCLGGLGLCNWEALLLKFRLLGLWQRPDFLTLGRPDILSLLFDLQNLRFRLPDIYLRCH